MESKVINHFCHEHPLILKENASDKVEEGTNCYACGTPVSNLEMAYVCMNYICNILNIGIILHKKCGELPLQISHPKHPGHLLNLFDFRKIKNSWCDLCGRYFGELLGYKCSSCNFGVDTTCVDSLLEGRQELQHPSHPDHPLTLMRKPAFAFRCDGCGAQDVDMAYICSTCEFWVHKSCALLPITLPRNHQHHHPLDLIFSLPEEHFEYRYRCDVCDKFFDRTCWVYFCRVCRYFVHLKCVGSHSHLIEDDDDGGGGGSSDVIHFNCQEIPNKNHNFTLYKSKGRETISHWFCNLCNFPTNGMGYACEECDTKIDVKCAALPTTSSIQYFAHRRHHKPQILTRIPPQEKFGTKKENKCHLCRATFDNSSRTVYCCNNDDCDFALHPKCALLPRSITEHEWDNKHPLLLMYDAFLDHPSDFYCEFCEEEMNPKSYKYHCRQCDISFHRFCLETKSGEYRNIKLGRKFELGDIHPNHPLTYTYVTLKRRCDVCEDEVYTYLGFECASCYYVVCEDCGCEELANII